MESYKLFLIITLVVSVLQNVCSLGDEEELDMQELLYEAAHQLQDMIDTNDTVAQMWEDHLRRFKTIQKRATPFDFECGLPDARKPAPSSVHDLRPEDVKVIGAMGDSLTAANGALGTRIMQVLLQYRGVSWSIGGDKSLDQGILTLPNIIRKYNPNLVGFSTGTGNRYSSGSNFNVAEAGHTSLNMPSQAKMLINRIWKDRSVDYAHDWKVITVFVGGNDLCRLCIFPASHDPSNYLRRVREALDILHAKLPRTFVNLVEIFDVTPVAKLGDDFFCDVLHSIACGCGKSDTHTKWLQSAALQYQGHLQELISTGRYDTRDDFTVVLQPYFRNTVPPKDHTGEYDLSYFAPDCFHFSEKGHQAAAASLWNNMLQPLSQKETTWDASSKIMCPENYGRQNFATKNN